MVEIVQQLPLKNLMAYRVNSAACCGCLSRRFTMYSSGLLCYVTSGLHWHNKFGELSHRLAGTLIINVFYFLPAPILSLGRVCHPIYIIRLALIEIKIFLRAVMFVIFLSFVSKDSY